MGWNGLGKVLEKGSEENQRGGDRRQEEGAKIRACAESHVHSLTLSLFPPKLHLRQLFKRHTYPKITIHQTFKIRVLLEVSPILLFSHDPNYPQEEHYPDGSLPGTRALAAQTLRCGHALKSGASWNPQTRFAAPHLLLFPRDKL